MIGIDELLNYLTNNEIEYIFDEFCYNEKYKNILIKDYDTTKVPQIKFYKEKIGVLERENEALKRIKIGVEQENAQKILDIRKELKSLRNIYDFEHYEFKVKNFTRKRKKEIAEILEKIWGIIYGTRHNL